MLVIKGGVLGMKNDLHVRTNISASAAKDWNWERVLQKCEQEGIKRLSITDFDTCLFHVINKLVDTNKYFSGQIITGMECDVCEKGLTFELLAYNFDPMKTLIWAYETYGTLEMRQTKIKDLLLKKAREQKIKIDTTEKFNGKVDFGHKYIYESMQKVKENTKFFAKYKIENLSDFYSLSTKQKDFPLYVSLNEVFPTVEKVTNFIHTAGGFVVLAQPCKSKNKDNFEFILKTALSGGVDGLEVYHPSHSKEDIQFLLNYCKKNKLIVTGGSNFNGKPENNVVGIVNIDKGEKEILNGVAI